MYRVFFLCLIGFLFAMGANSKGTAATFKDGKISPSPSAQNSKPVDVTSIKQKAEEKTNPTSIQLSASNQLIYEFSAAEFDEHCKSKYRPTVSPAKYRKSGIYTQVLRSPGGVAPIITKFKNGKASTKIRDGRLFSVKTKTEVQDTPGLLNITVSFKHPEGSCYYFCQAKLKQDKVLAPNSALAEQSQLTDSDEQRKVEEEQLRLAELEKQRKAEEEQMRLKVLEKQRKSKEEQRRLAQADNSAPYIELRVIQVDGYDAQIGGLILDDTGIKSAQINGSPLKVDENGEFNVSVYVPRTGAQITIQALDEMGKISEEQLFIERQERAALEAAKFDGLNPTKRRAKKNRNAIALIIGISSYQRTEVPAIYADDDAKYFYDYAMLKLGVPESNIREFINENADQFEILLATKKWLKRQVVEDKSDIYLFFAGHGLASEDGNKMFMLPYDGAPELLDKTGILREELFTDIALTNPRSVTIFMDTCYSGTTRGEDTLIASRPIAIRAKRQIIPDGFTVFTAASAKETAKPLEEAKHGMFSYFVMKGMEGEADLNRNNEITAKELHEFVQKNVVKQSSGKQTPELQGVEDKVLVRFE